jgi:hypothetical protein
MTDDRRKQMNEDHAVRFAVDYPDRELNRLATAFRVFAVIPIAIVVGTIGGYASSGHGTGSNTTVLAIGGTGLLFLPPLLMIVFRQKYPAGGSTGTSNCCASRTASASIWR